MLVRGAANELNLFTYGTIAQADEGTLTAMPAKPEYAPEMEWVMHFVPW
jgi:hypothetical protein